MKFLDYEKLGVISEALATREVGDKVLMGRVEAYSCKPAGDDKRLMKELGSNLREEGLSLLYTQQQQQQQGHPAGAAAGGAAGGLSFQPASYHHPHYRIPTDHLHLFPTAASTTTSGGRLHHTPPTGSGLRYGSMPTYLPSSAAGGGGGFSLSAATSPLGDLTDPGTRKLLVQLIATMNAVFPDYDFSGVRPEQFLREPDLRLVVADVHRQLFDLCDVVSPTFLEDLWAAVDEAVPLRECEVYSYLPDMEGDPFSDGNLWSFNYFFVHRRVKRIVFFSCIAKSKFQTQMEAEEEGTGGSDEDGGGANGGMDYEEQYWVDDL